MTISSRAALLVLSAAVLAMGSCAECPWRQSADRATLAEEEAWYASANRPPTATTLSAMAQILSSQGRDDEAKFILNKVIQDHPQYAPAYVDLAALYMRARQVDAAMAVLKAGLEAQPKDAVLINNLGMCHMTKGEYEQALAQFERAAAVTPDDVRWRANMAVALGMMGRYEESMALYNQVLAPADANYNLGVLCEARGDKQRAAEYFKEAEFLRLEAEAKAKGQTPPTREQVQQTQQPVTAPAQ